MLEVRDAQPHEYGAVAEVVAGVYVEEGWAGPDYEPTLRDTATRAQQTDVLVALLDGVIVGTVTLALQGGDYAEQAGADESVIRMLATTPAARGQGVARALVDECVRRSREAGRSVVRLSTQPKMLAAQRLYERVGFTRTPDRDWSPVEGLVLMTYELPLAYCGHCGQPGTHPDCAKALELEPPRYCTKCRRRMVVQVHPTGWSARCVEHGTLTS